ncbi:suppressor of rasval19 [Stygiomarasmius scandens]|uniref:Adenylyl cyclase-associated protein n=1 Tax=Marasmiellus scandens TaxID=2682957 RepID=A0ABR1JZ31_9AGAR
MSSQGLHSLTTIIKRLEAATSRIEDLAAAGWPSKLDDLKQPQSTPTPYATTPVPSAPPAPPPTSSQSMEVPKSVVAFDEAIIEGKLKPFVQLTRSFASPSVIEMVGLVEKQHQELRSLLATAAACTKPDGKAFENLLAPLNTSVEAISRAKEANRKDRDWFNHITVIGESAAFVAWVLNPKPGPYISEVKDQMLYYGNRVIKEFKEKDARHAEWVRAFTAIFDEMRKYIMEFHSTGLTWNARGVSVAEFSSKSPAPATGGAPPPPPPPPPPPAAAPPPASNAAASGTAAVFAELNRGAEVTKNLRKVDKSEMTHKNPELRAGSTVPSSSGPTTAKKPLRPAKPQALMGKKPPKFALEGKSWTIEYQEDEKNLVVEDTELNQAINIFGCKNSTIQVKGKVNAVTLVNCTKTAVLIDSVVSSISITKSPSFGIQVTGSAPMIQIDSTDSGQIFLSKSSLNAEITTAKCSSINVNLPVEGEEEGVFQEQPVPEMLRTIVKDGKLVTMVVEHVG